MVTLLMPKMKQIEERILFLVNKFSPLINQLFMILLTMITQNMLLMHLFLTLLQLPNPPKQLLLTQSMFIKMIFCIILFLKINLRVMSLLRRCLLGRVLGQDLSLIHHRGLNIHPIIIKVQNR